jgi:hypothetical protein
MPTLSQRVDPPIPIPPAISLPRSAQTPDDGARWQLGVRFLPEAEPAVVLDDYCFPTVTLGSYTAPSEVEQLPFTINAFDRCSALSMFARDYQNRARRIIEAATPKAVESEFWNGSLAQARGWTNQLYLRKAGLAQDLTPATVPSLNRAIGILEQALASCGFGGLGMIHGARETAPNFTGARRDGNVLRTITDNVFVPGVGYPSGNNPTGPIGNANTTPPAGQTWLYATGMVQYRESPPDLFPTWPQGGQIPQWAIDRATNTVQVPVARAALAYWDGVCTFACRATLPT